MVVIICTVFGAHKCWYFRPVWPIATWELGICSAAGFLMGIWSLRLVWFCWMLDPIAFVVEGDALKSGNFSLGGDYNRECERGILVRVVRGIYAEAFTGEVLAIEILRGESQLCESRGIIPVLALFSGISA